MSVSVDTELVIIEGIDLDGDVACQYQPSIPCLHPAVCRVGLDYGTGRCCFIPCCDLHLRLLMTRPLVFDSGWQCKAHGRTGRLVIEPL